MSNNSPIIGLHMIVRDEAATIKRCLESIVPHVDHVLVLDTGSEDDTVKIARSVVKKKGKVLTAPWPNHFGKARQKSLDLLFKHYPDTTHVFWCDGDDVVSGAEHLRALAAQLTPPAAGLLMHYAYAIDPAGNLGCSHFRERLLDRRAIKGWIASVHELIDLQPGWQLAPCAAPATSALRTVEHNTWPCQEGGIEVIHTRVTEKDLNRNIKILEQDLKANPDDPRILFYLSQEYAIQGAIEVDLAVATATQPLHEHDLLKIRAPWLHKAIAALEKYDPLSGWDEERYQALHRRADFLRILSRHGEALDIDRKATELLPTWPDAWFGLAESYLALGKPGLAIEYGQQGFAKPYPQTMLILNPLDYSATALLVHARALQALGRPEEGLAAVRRAAGLVPYDQSTMALEALLDRVVNRDRIKGAVLALDEALARHDENLKAATLLEQVVPYFLTDDADIAARRVNRAKGVRHIRQHGHYRRYYQTDNEVFPIELSLRAAGYMNGDGSLADGITKFCERLPRAQFLLAGLKQQGDLKDLTLLDVGCNDGWLGWWLVSEHGLGGYLGIDLSREAIDVARSYDQYYSDDVAQKVRFKVGEAPAAITQDYDAVACFEVLEHVPDPTIHLCMLSSLVKEGGRVYLSTPNGAFEKGNIADWDSPEPRGHVRALRSADVAGLCLDQGTIEGMAETQDGLVVASYTPIDRKGTLDFYLGALPGLWNPLDILDKGLRGSETMAVRMATRLSARGWRVRLYGYVERAMIQQVEYLPWYLFDPTEQRDVLICSRIPDFIKQEPEARHRVLWLHDAEYLNLHDYVPLWDEAWLVGEWQKKVLDLDGHKNVRVTRNGIPLENWMEGDRGFLDREPALVYSSDMNRGIVELLQCWDDIVHEYRQVVAYQEDTVTSAVEAPKLHICYGFTDGWMQNEKVHPVWKEMREYIESMVNAPGVQFHGMVGQRRLAELQLNSRVWAYPTMFPEVSCLTAMEAQAAGLGIVYSAFGELPNTVGKAGQAMPPTETWSERDRVDFIHYIVDLLTDRDVWDEAHARALAGARRWDVEELADEWDKALVMTYQTIEVT